MAALAAELVAEALAPMTLRIFAGGSVDNNDPEEDDMDGGRNEGSGGSSMGGGAKC